MKNLKRALAGLLLLAAAGCSWIVPEIPPGDRACACGRAADHEPVPACKGRGDVVR